MTDILFFIFLLLFACLLAIIDYKKREITYSILLFNVYINKTKIRCLDSPYSLTLIGYYPPVT